VPYRVTFHPTALREFLDLRRQDRDDFEIAIRRLTEHPFRGGPGSAVERLSGSEELWKLKLRHPQRRAFYRVDGSTIRMLGFGPRPEFYLKLRDRSRLSPDRGQEA
jgi:mRNA-degrading endonuclease RelE of RelBE toxin-antitoxin system